MYARDSAKVLAMLSGVCRLLPVNIVYESDVHILKKSNKNSLNCKRQVCPVPNRIRLKATTE